MERYKQRALEEEGGRRVVGGGGGREMRAGEGEGGPGDDSAAPREPVTQDSLTHMPWEPRRMFAQIKKPM